MANYIIPIFIIFVLIFSIIKKINAYDCFVSGARQAIDLCINTFPYLVAIFAIVELLSISGLSSIISRFFSSSLFTKTPMLFSHTSGSFSPLRKASIITHYALRITHYKKTEVFYEKVAYFNRCWTNIG